MSKTPILVLSFLAGLASVAPGICEETPPSVPPAKKYVLYMHGAWLEMHGLRDAHPVHGVYDYEGIVGALRAKGYEVISEVRASEVPFGTYADGVVSQIQSLLAEGVQPEQITVLGHSKGGLMTLIAAARLQEPKLNYIVMAGCGRDGTSFRRPYQIFLNNDARNLQGRFLSLYDADDREAGSCREAFAAARGAETRETVLETGRGHGLFYSPREVWLDRVAEWIETY